MEQKKSKSTSPRIKIIQKIYNSLMNPGTKIDYPKSQYKKFIKDVVSGTLERSELIEETINKNLINDINLKKTEKLLKIILFAAIFELMYKHNNPKKTEAYYNRGISKEALEDYKGALEDYEKALLINPDDYLNWQAVGTVKIFIGDFNGSISALNSSIELNPNNIDAYYNRGWAKAQINDHSGAISYYATAVNIDPSF